MSKSINVNPGQYKVGGRERRGEPPGQAKDKQDLVKNRERHERKVKTGKKRQTR